MNKETLTKLDHYRHEVAKQNCITAEQTKTHFSVEPSAHQRLEQAVLENSDFLKQINIITVQDQVGETLRLGSSTPIASRTADGDQRKTNAFHSLTANKYECVQTNFDTHLKYAQLDAWAKFPNFANKVSKLKAERIALDRIMIGFNGEKAESQTNITTNPLLQDVNKGWIALIKENAKARILSESKTGTNKVTVNANATDQEVTAGEAFRNLDALVYAMKEDFIEPQFKNDTKLVAILGSDLLADKYFGLLNQKDPTERLAGDIMASMKKVGGLQAITVPYFPKNAVLVTSLDNLSIYTQEGKARRAIIDRPDYNHVADFLSLNEAYVVEEYGAVAYIENIEVIA